MASDSKEDKSSKGSDDLFSGRGAPALMSSKEPAIQGLKERYSESFAFTKGSGMRVHLFLIKFGLWSLVWTFTPRDLGTSFSEMSVDDTLGLLENSLEGHDNVFLSKLDSAVLKAKTRIQLKAVQFGLETHRD